MIAGQGSDFIIVKCNSVGIQQWVKTYNGPYNESDTPSGIFVDDQGNVYVTGTSEWTSGVYKIVTIKYSSTGNLLWKTAFDSLSQSDSRAEDIWVDNNGNVLVTGWIAQTFNSDYDMVTIKMDNNGNISDWAYLGQVTSGEDFGRKIISDSNGNIYVGGDSFRNVTLGREAIIVKYNSNLDTSWVVRVNGNDNYYNEFAIEVAFDDTGNVYALCRLQNDPGFTDFAILKTNSNGGVVWRVDYDEAGGQDIPEDMAMDDEGNIYVTGRVRRASGGSYNDFATIKYNNAGVQQWISYYNSINSLDDIPYYISLDQDGNIYVAGESNVTGSFTQFTVVKYSASGSFIWDYIYEENVESKAIGVWPDNTGFVYAAGEGEAPAGNQDLMAVKLSTTTGVEYENILPNSFELFQNYPNPFNPTTIIKYTIPSVIANEVKQSHLVTLKVYDILGNEVVTLVNEEMPSGVYQIGFDASNFSSGVYFYQLKAGDPSTSSGLGFIQTKKMILTK